MGHLDQAAPVYDFSEDLVAVREAEAGRFLDFLGTLDPTWKVRIEIIRTDKNWDATKTLASLASYVLDAGLHTVISPNPYFDD